MDILTNVSLTGTEQSRNKRQTPSMRGIGTFVVIVSKYGDKNHKERKKKEERRKKKESKARQKG